MEWRGLSSLVPWYDHSVWQKVPIPSRCLLSRQGEQTCSLDYSAGNKVLLCPTAFALRWAFRYLPSFVMTGKSR